MLQYLKELMPIFRKASTKIGKILENTKISPLKDVKGARRNFYSLMIDSKVGNPFLEGATVLGEVIKNGKQRKIRIFKYKSICFRKK